MRSWLVGAAVVAVACHGDRTASRMPVAPASTALADLLWSKAPDDSDVGVVVTARGLVMAEHAWQDVHAFVKSTPELAAFERELSQVMGMMGVRDFAWSEVGVDPTKGFAVFLIDHERSAISVFGLTDRDRFVKRSLGTRGADYDRMPNMICKPVADGYYGCTRGNIANLARIGKGHLRAKLGSASARGDVEVVIDAPPVEVAAVVQLERGAFVVRGVADVPASVADLLGPPVKPRLDLDHVSGFAVLNVAPLLAKLPPVEIAPGVNIADLARTIAGPLTITMRAGDVALDARIPLNDAGAATKLVEHCLDLPGLRELGARLERGVCRIPVPQYAVTLEVRTEGNELQLSGRGGTPANVPATALGRELATGPWSATFWGRGTLLSARSWLAPDTASELPSASLAVRVLLMIDEIGFAVADEGDRIRFVLAMRTAWSNPDDVAAKLLAVAPEPVLAGRGGELGKPIADSAPRSPFATDRVAGSTGLMIPISAIGLLAGVALPGAFESQKRSREPESVTTLNRIGKALKRYHADHGNFPIGDATTLPDFPTCCGLSSTGHGIDNFCPNSAKAWRGDKIWSALGIEIAEPTVNRYGYHSDGKTVDVTATADTDCDGKPATFTLHGDAPNGSPELLLIKPPAGVY